MVVGWAGRGGVEGEREVKTRMFILTSWGALITDSLRFTEHFSNAVLREIGEMMKDGVG